MRPDRRWTVGIAALLLVGFWGVYGTPDPHAQHQPAASKTTASEVGGVWDDLVTVAGAINPLGADGQAVVIADAATYLGCLEFNAAGETAVAQFQLSHGTMDNTDLKPHVHWLVTGADVTGSTTFQAKFRHCPLSGTCSAWTAFADGTVLLEPADADGATGLTTWTLADGTYNFGISDIILMQLKLSATTVTDSVVCSVDIHYQKSGLGTTKEAVR